MEQQELIASMMQELRRGTLVLCVLGQLKTPMYGYSLVQELTQKGVTVEANTLYPLLRRLEGQGLLCSTWETSGAKPRKYYQLTDMGGEVYQKLKAAWENTVESVQQAIADEKGGAQHAGE